MNTIITLHIKRSYFFIVIVVVVGGVVAAYGFCSWYHDRENKK